MFPSTTYVAFQDKDNPDDWRVELAEAGVEPGQQSTVAIFCGHEAEERAVGYAWLMSGSPMAAWRERPTCPGLWLCVTKAGSYPKCRPNCLDLDAKDLARGVPFGTHSVYGPIPPEPTGEAYID